MKILVLAVAAAILLTPAVAQQRPIPVVLDTDIGDDIDDALALGLALNSPELNVLAVITVLQQGDRRADLTYRILDLYHRTDIPVGVGAETTLMGKPNNDVVKQTTALPPDYHLPAAKRHNGIQLMIDTILRASQPVTLLAYGPLTNVALALRAEPRIVKKLERIVLMNGVFFRAGLEYNTYRDAEASAIVYNSGVPITAVGLDVTMQCRLSADHLRAMAESKYENIRFLRQLIGVWQGENPNQFPILHDPLSVMVAFRPTLVETSLGTVQVDTKGTPGISYGLSAFKLNQNGTVHVAREVRADQAVSLFMERMTAPRAR